MKANLPKVASLAVLSLAMVASAFAQEVEEPETPGVTPSEPEASRAAVPTDFARQVMIAPSEGLGLGEAVLTNFPVLVRLSEAIDGFRYADFKAENHADMMFVDDRGNAMPYEVQAWDAPGTSDEVPGGGGGGVPFLGASSQAESHPNVSPFFFH